MGLLNMLRKMKASNEEARILVLGLDNAGKTTILKKLSEESIEDIEPTQGFNIKSINVMGFKINVWDIGGQKAIRKYWDQYIKDTDVLIYVVDSMDTARMEEAKEELDKLMKREQLSKCPVLIYANKQDLLGAADPAEITTTLQLEATGRTFKIQACSAKTGDGLKEGMEWAMKQLVAKSEGKHSFK